MDDLAQWWVKWVLNEGDAEGLELVKLLLNDWTDVNVVVTDGDSVGGTPIWWVARAMMKKRWAFGMEVAKWLMDKGTIDLNVPGITKSGSECPPLHYAARVASKNDTALALDFAKLLLDGGAAVNGVGKWNMTWNRAVVCGKVYDERQDWLVGVFEVASGTRG